MTDNDLLRPGVPVELELASGRLVMGTVFRVSDEFVVVQDSTGMLHEVIRADVLASRPLNVGPANLP